MIKTMMIVLITSPIMAMSLMIITQNNDKSDDDNFDHISDHDIGLGPSSGGP